MGQRAVVRRRAVSRRRARQRRPLWGEVYETTEPDQVLAGLDEIEGYDAAEPDQSLYLRQQVTVTFPEGPVETSAWIYFYNAPLGHAELIPSGDYLAHFRR